MFIIVGATYSGKDELANAMQEMESGRVVNYRKATNRPEREGDDGQLRHLQGVSVDEFDLLYGKNEFEYGISTRELWGNLAKGNISLIVLNDRLTIERLLGQFGEICCIIYLHANFNESEMKERMTQEGASEIEMEQRLKTVRELHELYVKETLMFDHVLLNTAEPEDLSDQAFNILDHYCRGGQSP
jgi:guanylate kinase